MGFLVAGRPLLFGLVSENKLQNIIGGETEGFHIICQVFVTFISRSFWRDRVLIESVKYL